MNFSLGYQIYNGIRAIQEIGLLACKYNRRPTNLLYCSASTRGSSSPLSSLKPCSIGKELGRHPSSPMSRNISKVYFLWLCTRPSFILATSIPRNYVKRPRSLIVNCLLRSNLVDLILIMSFPTIMTSST
ncbi:hypothetical protein Hdeb2414_s0011g00367881 [Helianthus debilis subsp. tardiflorus]